MKKINFGRIIGTTIYNTGIVSRALSSQTFFEKGFDLTPEQFLILDLVQEYGELYQRQICEITLKDRSNIARIVKILEEKELIKDTFLLTMKPIIYIANVSEEQLEKPFEIEAIKQVVEYAKQENAEVVPLCVKIEEELASLDGKDKKEMLEALGIEESGLDKVVKASYDLLGLMSFLTAGEPEVRAWTIKKGTKAPQAAGKIHSDIERGFIRAEIVSYDDLMREGSMIAAKEKGLVRSEGKEYIMQDGDIVLFRFNV